MRKRFNFNVPKAIQFAWDIRWADNLKRRAEDEKYAKKHGKTPYGYAKTFYLTATDLERTVRDLASFTAEGKEWPDSYDAPGFGYGMGVRFRGDLLRDIRRWLQSNSKLSGHNFNAGHISGARYRPRGEPIAPSEEETFKAKAKRREPGYSRPHHFRQNSGPLCQAERMKGRWRMKRSTAWMTNDSEKVTCVRCKNLMAVYKKLPKAKEGANVTASA